MFYCVCISPCRFLFAIKGDARRTYYLAIMVICDRRFLISLCRIYDQVTHATFLISCSYLIGVIAAGFVSPKSDDNHTSHCILMIILRYWLCLYSCRVSDFAANRDDFRAHYFTIMVILRYCDGFGGVQARRMPLVLLYANGYSALGVI